MIFGFFKRTPVADLEEGEEVELEIPSDNDEKNIFITESLGVTKKEIMLIAPLKNNEALSLGIGTEVIVHFTREDNIGTFTTEVIAEDVKSTPPVLTLSQPPSVSWEEKQANGLQRRQFVRFEVSTPLEFWLPSGSACEALTHDISGSGLSMISLFSMNLGTLIKLRISLPDKKINTTAKITRCVPLNDETTKGGRPRYEIALTFVNLDTTQQDMIMRYIFERQRELRRRGLL